MKHGFSLQMLKSQVWHILLSQGSSKTILTQYLQNFMQKQVCQLNIRHLFTHTKNLETLTQQSHTVQIGHRKRHHARCRHPRHAR